ncbi:MAG: DUF2071 domain-containing protein [Pyrinomonadaceae bacterium]
MSSLLKNHPFAVEAFFESSLVVAYAFPPEKLRPLVPSFLELDTFEDRWAFAAVAMVNTKGLRPKGSPRFLGADFFLVGYRVFVRFTDIDGKRTRGLYILGSRTDSRRMEFFGNIFTHYKYSTIDVECIEEGGTSTIHSENEGLFLKYEQADEEIPLPVGSPFSTWKEARRFAGPLPFTFTYTPGEDRLLIIEGVRTNWTPKPVRVLDHRFAFIENLGNGNGVLANAFIVEKIPYYWKKGRFVPIPS